METKYIILIIVAVVVIPVITILLINNFKKSSSSTPSPQEPFLNKEYPPIDITPDMVLRTNKDWYYNRFIINNQPNGNGQYDLAQSSCWYASNPLRNVYNIFNKEASGWLSGGGYDANTGLGSRQTLLVDGTLIFGEWVQVTFPKEMDFNKIKLQQNNNSSYSMVKELVILGNNDTSLKNAPVWNEVSPLSGPTLSPSTSETPVPFGNDNWNFIAKINFYNKLADQPETTLDPSAGQMREYNFSNSTKYNTYRLVVTKIKPGSSTSTSCTIDYVKFLKV